MIDTNHLIGAMNKPNIPEFIQLLTVSKGIEAKAALAYVALSDSEESR